MINFFRWHEMLREKRIPARISCHNPLDSLPSLESLNYYATCIPRHTIVCAGQLFCGLTLKVPVGRSSRMAISDRADSGIGPPLDEGHSPADSLLSL
jgi:hypothetical protein